MYKAIKKCRVCGNKNLVEILDLGIQTLTGVFPKIKEQKITSGPLILVKCVSNNSEKHCGLVQLKHTYALRELYGNNYGYRSGLNISMIKHLQNKVEKILNIVDLKDGDIIIDIGSNDATTLNFYPKSKYELIGIDPTGNKFRKYYSSHIKLIADFFNVKNIQKIINTKKVKIITTFSMFYDLVSPLDFAKDIASILDKDGIWVLEQSYMPAMLKQNSFDTICHEHLEYYCLTQIKWITEQIGLKIIDVEFNEVNGGSFSVIVGAANNHLTVNKAIINSVLEREKNLGLNTLQPYQEFAKRVKEIKQRLLKKINSIKLEGKLIYGLGASTKGNVLLQYCGITAKELPYIGDINEDKFGTYTPGSLIPIISEQEMLAKKADYLLVLPWHFRKFFDNNPKFKSSKLLYPLLV